MSGLQAIPGGPAMMCPHTPVSARICPAAMAGARDRPRPIMTAAGPGRTAVYLYHIDKEQNGTIVLDVLHSPRELIKGVDKVVDKTPEGKTKGTVSMGGATSDDLQGRLKGKSLSDLHELIVNGTVYVPIRTEDFPNGEIRGNSFVGIDRLFPDFVDIKWK